MATVPAMERLTLWDRFRATNPMIVDGLLAAAVFALVVVNELWFFNPPQPRGVDDPSGLVLVALACAPLAWRRRAPIVTLTITALAVVLYEGEGNLGDFVGLAFVLAVYTSAAYCDRALVLGAAVPISLAAALTIYLTGREPGDRLVDALYNAAFLVGVPMAFGRFEFNRRRRVRHDREGAARDAVAEERARIAREMHDAVAHAMSVMVVQAGAARIVMDRDPEQATAALQRIEDTGRSGLAEMRRLLGILGSDEEASLAPQPGLERLDDLLETARETGLPVEAMVEGNPRELPPGVDLTAYRVVQEALTNALKHAGQAHARVVLRYDEEALELEIADDGRGPLPDGTHLRGRGLIGMRERVALFGGSLETGARPGGGFVVRARIPLREST
jgi:signal transduction histidine kinase